MSQFNTYPGPKESTPFPNRRGGNAKSHTALGSNKATSGGDKTPANCTYKGKCTSYYKKG